MFSNDKIRRKARVSPIENKVHEMCHRWFNHVRGRYLDAQMKRSGNIIIVGGLD